MELVTKRYKTNFNQSRNRMIHDIDFVLRVKLMLCVDTQYSDRDEQSSNPKTKTHAWDRFQT